MNQSEIVDIIIKTINTIFNNIFSSIDNNIYDNLDSFTFIDSNIIKNSFFNKLFISDNKNSFIYLADAMLLAISIFYCIRYYYSNIVELNVEKPSQFLFKLVVFAILINFSYFIIEQILNINYLISSSIQEIGKNVIGCDISFSQLVLNLNKKISSNDSSLNLFSFDGIIKSFVSVGLLNLLFAYSLRYIIFQTLLLFTPFAILTAITYSSSWIFKSWFKSIFCLLIIQIFVSIVLIVIFCIDDNNRILLIGGIYSLIKINDYVREIFGGISLSVSNNFGNVFSTLKK